AALFTARRVLGADVMDTLVLEAHFSLSTTETFFTAAQAVLDADQDLFGGQHAAILRPIFIDQGLSRDLTPAADLPPVAESLGVSLDNPRIGSSYPNHLDDSETFTQPGALGLRVHFAQIDTETNPACFQGGCDNIYLYDAQGNLYQVLNGA